MHQDLSGFSVKKAGNGKNLGGANLEIKVSALVI